ncbi:MAG: hypothetical protein J6B77_09195 [Clostridia bacterium]|nr:hypothetical protein [Clostridia bacterium]
MEYICPEDYEYIINKYHDTSKPFDPFKRFIRHDEIFSEDSGMPPEEILAGITENDRLYAHLPHSVRKARALEYVLKNTRISCDRRDVFPALNMMDRPLREPITQVWRKEVFGTIIPEVEAKRKALEKAGAVTIWPDYDHSVPDWDRILSLGFEGILRESESARAKHSLSAEEDAFFESIRITYTAIIDLIGRLAALADRTEGAEKLARALHRIQHGAPSTFYEALLTNYLYFIICEHIEGLQVRSLSNFDRLFFGFYENDLKNGVSEDELRRDLAYYFLQFTAIGNYWNQPVYIGGENADGSTVINALSYVFLDVYDKMKIYNPKIQIKVSKSTPKELLLKALDMIRHGNNSIVFVCDETIRKALVRAGLTEEQARTCDIKGCYEYAVRGGMAFGMNYLNLLKPLEYALHGGCDGVSGGKAGLDCADVAAYDSFDAFLAEYKRQLCEIIRVTIETVNAFENYLAYINPQAMISATFSSCLEKKRDALLGGGVTNGSTISIGFLADAVDSLLMIKKYVYERKELTLAQFRDILDRDYEGAELFRKKLLGDREKYGNNMERPDALAVELFTFVRENIVGKPNASGRGGTWNCSFHSARMTYVQGKKTAASPNGRRLGEELSKNVSASMGQNRAGATAAILSATKLDATAITSDVSLDLGLLPSAVRGEDGLRAMLGLLMTFCRRGGHALHINVFDADTLRDAQANPEKYADLQIRVSGWNVLWNNINKEEQDGFIRQAEALI